MKVKLLVSRSGPNGSQVAGDVIEVDGAAAKRMIEARQAEPVRSGKPKPEKAVKA